MSTQPKKELAKLRTVAKIILATDDILNASKIIGHYLKLVKNESHELHKPLQQAFIVAYTRPFAGNDLGILPKKYSRFENNGYDNIHNDLIALRNQHIAHSDKAAHRVFIFSNNTLLHKLSNPSPGNGYSIDDTYFNVDTMKTLSLMTSEVLNKLREDCIKNIDELVSAKGLDGLYEVLTLKKYTELPGHRTWKGANPVAPSPFLSPDE